MFWVAKTFARTVLLSRTKFEYSIVDGPYVLPADMDAFDDIEIEPASDVWNLESVSVEPVAEETGVGVDVYVLDTGIQGRHVSFGDRVDPGVSFTGPDPWMDCSGHGTHVASTVGGVGFGVATGATLIPVQMFVCNGNAPLSAMIQGVNWIIQRATRTKRKSIVNMSIQATAHEAIDRMVRELVERDILVVVAAGNFNSPACNYSPAREPLAVTVGGVDENDEKTPSSNFGSCVDIWAPGIRILGAAPWGPPYTLSITKTGTSMATPLVVGVAATIWQRYPKWTVHQVIDHLPTRRIDLGGVVTALKGLATSIYSNRSYAVRNLCIELTEPTRITFRPTQRSGISRTYIPGQFCIRDGWVRGRRMHGARRFTIHTKSVVRFNLL